MVSIRTEISSEFLKKINTSKKPMEKEEREGVSRTWPKRGDYNGKKKISNPQGAQ